MEGWYPMSNTDNPIDPLYTVTKVAALFGVKSETIRSWIKTGRIKAIKIGTHYRIPRSEIVRIGKAKF